MLPALAAVNGKQQSPQPGRLQVPAGRGHFFAAGSPQRGTMAERKQRRWLAKRAGSLLFVCRGRKAAGRAVRVPSGDFRKRQKKKRFLVSLEPLLWCAGRDSPAPLRTVRRTVRPGRDARRPDGLFESLPEISGNNKKEEVPCFLGTSSLVQRNIRHPNFLG